MSFANLVLGGCGGGFYKCVRYPLTLLSGGVCDKIVGKVLAVTEY
jgi:hypothetical protein